MASLATSITFATHPVGLFRDAGSSKRVPRNVRIYYLFWAVIALILPSMPLASYGILKGTLYTPQEQTYQGDWFHGIFYLNIPGATNPQRCVTDFSSANKDLIQYKIFNNLQSGLFANMEALANGYTALAATSTSGALDYVRSAILGPAAGTAISDGWIVSDGIVAVQLLQKQLSNSPRTLYVFGQPFDTNAKGLPAA